MFARPAWFPATLLLLITCTASADEVRERQLEIDVAQLRRQLLEQSRRIDELERAVRLGQPPRSARPAAKTPEAAPAWLIAANWNRIKTSMTELEVIAILGAPSSLREGRDGSTRTLLYALEIGTGAFLAGSVQIGPRGVESVAKPELR